MIHKKEISHYNVVVNDGNLNHDDNRWYYGLQIDKFNDEDEWLGNNCFYIKGHIDGNEKEKLLYSGAISDWLRDAEESKIADMFTYRKNFVFEIQLPTKVTLV